MDLSVRGNDVSHLWHLRYDLHLWLHHRTELLYRHLNGMVHGLPVGGRDRHLHGDRLLHGKLNNLRKRRPCRANLHILPSI